METIAICDFPKADYNQKIILIIAKEIESKVLIKLEELGWVWSGSHLRPTMYNPRDDGWTYGNSFKIWLRDDCCLYHSNLKYTEKLWNEFEVVDIISPQKTINLKTANISPSATNCASCGGKLKDPGMGPLYKHCPKCEP
jgi:hypothetical protein